MADQQRINGNVYSWSSIEVKLDGEKFTGIKSIKYGHARERVKAYGLARHHAPIGRTAGKYTTEPVVISMYKHAAAELRAALAKKADDDKSYGDVEFEIVVQYTEGDLSGVTVNLERCVLTKESSSNDEGTDPTVEELEADCFLIRTNGLTLFNASEGAA